MHQTHTIEVGEKLLAANRKLADENAALLKGKGVLAVDFVGAIGSGKTLLIERLVDLLAAKGVRCAVIAGDPLGNDDYLRFVSHHVQAANLNTGKECHLDAHLVRHAIEDLDLTGIHVLFIENVGNLLCPVDFPTGAHLRLVVISTTEGDDMVRKHPNIFVRSDAMVLNKVDLAPLVDVDPARIVSDFSKVAPHSRHFLTNARKCEGVDELAAFLLSKR